MRDATLQFGSFGFCLSLVVTPRGILPRDSQASRNLSLLMPAVIKLWIMDLGEDDWGPLAQRRDIQ